MRHRFLGFCLSLLCFTAAACVPHVRNATEGEAERPNIIFILADDLGYGDLGAYGQTRIQTPHLDRLAREGMRFTQFYAGSTVCAPSRSVLMTGLHTGHTRIRGNSRTAALMPDDVTVAEVLKQAGYTTGLIGKWGLGPEGSPGHPNRQGFDYFFGYLDQRHAHNYYPTFLVRNDERVRLANTVPNEDQYGAGVSDNKLEYSHDLFMEEALQFVERNAGGPFFLYLALTLPHANNEARQEGMEVPSYEPYAGKDWPEARKGFAAMVTRMDTGIGRLMEQLRREGIAENTLVFFTSDNGPHAEGGHDPAFFDSNGPLRGIKRDLYEGGIRVPMIAYWPGVTPAGSVSDYVGYFADVLPTLAEAAGAPAPGPLDGISFLPAIKGRPDRQAAHEYLYWEFYEGGGKQAVRSGPWKAVRTPMGSGPIELYHLDRDLGEQNDVSAAHPEVVARMERIMERAHTPSPDWNAGAAGP